MKTAAVTLALCLSVATGDDRCIGGWKTGDGEGPLGSAYETSLGTADSREACIDAVQALSDGPNAATYATYGQTTGYCYAEYGQTTVDTSCTWCSVWENCLLTALESDSALGSAHGCDGTCAVEDLHEGHCGAFWTEVENKWKDWVVLGWEELGCQKDTCCASSSSACCELNVGLVAGLACGGLVFILCCVALCCFTCTGCPAYKARHKKTRSGIQRGEAPPLAPITLGGVEVDVSQEGVCSPRRVNMVYAPLATWYNTTGKGAALRAKHGPLPANPDAFNKWASMKEVTMAFLDDAGVPPAF